MKKGLLFISLLFILPLFLKAQITVAYHEDFELPSLNDSVTTTQTIPGTDDWAVTKKVHQNSLRADSCKVKTGATTNLITSSFSTLNNTSVTLSFGQICKIDFLDLAKIWVSIDGGANWIQLTGTQYLGTGQFAANGNRFASNSYGALWQPSNANAIPVNGWWKTEQFDISALCANQPDVRIKWSLQDAGTAGAQGNYGWIIDNIVVTMSFSEMIPPTITLTNPIIQGPIFSVGPFPIKAKVSDLSGIDTAYVIYTINNGPNDTVGMIHTVLDTMVGYIPSVNDSDVVCYWVEAKDDAPAHNWARNPVGSCISFTAYAGITFPFYDNFDVFNLWTPTSSNGSIWQLGTPAYGVTTGAHSAPNAWDVELSAAYQASTTTGLTSPVFDFSNAANAKLSVWMNYYTEQNYDGTQLQYTIDGINYQTLGAVNSPGSTNWYNMSSIYSTSQPAWAGTSSSVAGSTNGWFKAKYKLTELNNVVGQVRFRFYYTSDGSVQYDGFSIDDFSIVLPAPQEAAINNIITPVSDCGLHNETVKIDLVNVGLTPINGGLTASFRKGNGPIVTETVPGLIPPGDTVVYTFTTPIDLTVGLADSNFTIKAWVTLANDPNHGDDSTSKVVTSKHVPLAPQVTSVLIPYGTSTVITATSPDPIEWFSALVAGVSLGTGPNYTTPILYGMTIYYPQATASNGCVGPRAKDTVYVGNPPPFDASVTSFTTPVSAVNMGAAEAVTINVRNYGTQPISNYTVKYSINNNAPVSQVVVPALASGAAIPITFTQTANLSQFGTYQFKAWVVVAGDANHVNDTAVTTVVNSMYNYCISEAQYTSDMDLGNVTLSNLNNGNPNPSTYNTNATQLYTDFTNLAPAVLMRNQSYPVSISQINNSYAYPAYCKIFIDWNYDGTFDEATETAWDAGLTNTSPLVMTLNGIIDVPGGAHLGLTRMRVVLQEYGTSNTVHPCGTYSYGETEDYNVIIIPQLHIDAGVTAIVNPASTYPQGYSVAPQVTIKNFGLDPIASVNVAYKMDGGAPVVQNYANPIASGAIATVNFPAINLPNGAHTFCAYTMLPSDTNYVNDTLCKAIYGVPVDTLPYYDNFDGTPQKFTATQTSGTNWINGAPNNAFPTTAHSAPNVWATNLNIPPYTSSANCELVTQIFDWTSAFNPTIAFWYRSYTESSYDGFRLEYSTDGGTNWALLGTYGDILGTNWYNVQNIYSSNQPAWAGTQATWKRASYKLNNFNGQATMRFRFLFTSDPSVNYDGSAIDDFSITIPYHKDAGFDTIKTPSGASDVGTALSVTARLINYGMDTLYNVDLVYKAGTQAPVTEVYPGPLFPGDTVIHQFAQTYIPEAGDYLLKVYTSLPVDGDHQNDTARKTLFGIPIYTLPYEENFDSIHFYWYPDGKNWAHGVPASVLMNTPYSPPYCWKTNLTAPYIRTGNYEFLYSPKFDFSDGMDSLVFYHWVDINQYDGGKIEYLANDGTWKVLGSMGDPNALNWYTSTANTWINDGGVAGWHKSSYDLKIVTDWGFPTQFRFAFYSMSMNTTRDGWSVDNFKLTTPKIPQDAGVISVNSPTGTTVYGTNINVNVTIKNFGSDTLNVIPVKYQFNGITVGAGTWTGTLLPDSTTTFTFVPMPSPLSNYQLCAYTDVPFDTKFSNDTACTFITVNAPNIDLGVVEIISPVNQTIHGNEAEVTVKIKNFGLNTVNEVPITYTVGGDIVVNETYTTPLAHGAEATYTFTTKYKYTYLGYYYLCAYTSAPGDGYLLNDTLCKKVEELFTSIGELDENGYGLSQNVPNPSNNLTQVVYHLPKPAEITFEVVDVLGQKMLSRSEKASEGDHTLTIDTQTLPAGIYYYYLVVDKTRLVRKMMIAR